MKTTKYRIITHDLEDGQPVRYSNVTNVKVSDGGSVIRFTKPDGKVTLLAGMPCEIHEL